jgi:putative molybdopterin biosynthesis protein
MDIRNNLAQVRGKRGLKAAQLAEEAGVTRQTVYAIEAGTYVPNTAVSLKLARVLDATVEELFQIEPEINVSAEVAEAVVLDDPDSMQPGQPLRLCRVNGHIIAVPSEQGSWGLSPTDAAFVTPVRGGKRSVNAKVEIFGHGWNDPNRILVAGCDPSATLLAHALQRQGYELVIAYKNSSRALELLREGMVHIAGTHLVDKATGKTDLRTITKMFPRNSVSVISYAMWQEGLVVAHDNPKKIFSIRDLTRKDVQITNREPGAGCRRLLDDLLQKHGIAASELKGYEHITAGHLPAARLVQSGEVDCCIGTQAGARALGLDFIPLTQKPYNLVVRQTQLKLPSVQALLETLARASFRRDVEASVGYEMRTAGERLV